MSESIFAVNTHKREYLDALSFGEYTDPVHFPQKYFAAALSMLTCDARSVLGLDPIAGSWSGDKVILVVDSMPPNSGGFTTSTAQDPDRNLYAMVWQDFRDVSADAVAMICNWIESASDEVASKINGEYGLNEQLLYILGDIAVDKKCHRLATAIEKHVGENWISLREKAKFKYER